MPKVLVVDDQAGDIMWLVDLLVSRGYRVDLATNKEAAIKRLDAVANKESLYSLAILDIMISIKDIMDVVEFNDDFYEQSRDAGIDLCVYAREKLKLSVESLPIICLSARDDEDAKRRLRDLKIPLFNRDERNPDESIRKYIVENLPVQID